VNDRSVIAPSWIQIACSFAQCTLYRCQVLLTISFHVQFCSFDQESTTIPCMMSSQQVTVFLRACILYGQSPTHARTQHYVRNDIANPRGGSQLTLVIHKHSNPTTAPFLHDRPPTIGRLRERDFPFLWVECISIDCMRACRVEEDMCEAEGAVGWDSEEPVNTKRSR